MIIYLNLFIMRGTFGVEYFSCIISSFSKMKISLQKVSKFQFWSQNFFSQAAWKRSQAEPSQAEYSSARTMARASSAQTHHY